MISKVQSLGLFGLNAYRVIVEADVTNGLPAFDIVGLPGTAVKESRDRVRAALNNSGLDFPHVHITVNLAPADIPKDTPVYDLPILIAIAAASGAIDTPDGDMAFVGELSLSGEIRPVSGILPMLIEAKNIGIKRFILPSDNAGEAGVVEGIEAIPVSYVTELLRYLNGDIDIKPVPKIDIDVEINEAHYEDFSEVRGQKNVKRALEIAAAGGHNILMIGPPGSGKSMLAKRLPSILPPMTVDEAIEVTKIYSVAGLLPQGESLIKTRPFRAPHHTISNVGLAGGGHKLRPGEVTAAHNGVLFLDELPEFSKSALDVLRQPLEDGVITISRAAGTLTFPSKITLVCAMNPCKCGNFGNPYKKCICSPAEIKGYLSRISGPLLDRIDLHVDVMPVGFEDIEGDSKEESSAEIRKRVISAREMGAKRFKGKGITCNAQMSHAQVREFCKTTKEALELLKMSFNTYGLTARSYDKVLKLARTVADLRGGDIIEAHDVAQVLQYRRLDKKYWG